MAVSLGKLTLGITLGEGVFEQSSRRVTRSFNRMIGKLRRDSKLADKAIGGIVSATRGLGRALSAVGKFGGAGLAAITIAGAGAVAMLKQLSDKYTELQRQSQEYGVTVRDLTLTQRLASDFGADYERLLDFRKDAQEKLGIALNEKSGEGFDALRLLGIDPNTVGEDVDKVLGMVMERVVKMSETRRKAILGMLAGVGADITTESIGVLLAQFGEKGEEVRKAYDNLIPSEETIERSIKVGVQLERIFAIVSNVKDKILTNEWMTKMVDFAQNFSFGLVELDKAGKLGEKMGEILAALKDDLKTVGVYFLDVMLWSISEMGKRLLPTIANSVKLGFTEGLPDWARVALHAGNTPLRLHTVPPSESAPFPQAGDFKIDNVAIAVAQVGKKITTTLDKVVADMTLKANAGAQPKAICPWTSRRWTTSRRKTRRSAMRNGRRRLWLAHCKRTTTQSSTTSRSYSIRVSRKAERRALSR